MGENRFKDTIVQDTAEQEQLPPNYTEDVQPITEPEAPIAQPEKNKAKKSKKGGQTVMSFLGGSFLVKEKFTKLFPFMVYVTILLMVIISNTYIAEERSREIAQSTRKLNDLQIEYIQLKSAIMQATKQSVLARELAETGIKESIEPLMRISPVVEEPQKSEKP